MDSTQSEKLFEVVERLSKDIDMTVNGEKTQLLCAHPSREQMSAYIINGEGNALLKSWKDWKILRVFQMLEKKQTKKNTKSEIRWKNMCA